MPGVIPSVAPFSFPIRIYWEDTDAGGIVFYANYLKFFERARTEWLRAAGVGQQRLRDESGGMFVVTHSNVRYVRPARLDDELIVTAQLTEKRPASLTIVQQALSKSVQNNHTPPTSDSSLLCEGSIRIGWVHATTMRPARIPSNILDLLK